jgi:ribonuclease HI
MIVCGLTDTKYRAIKVDESLEVPEVQIQIQGQYTFTGRKELKLYTDGSMIRETMGSACLFLEEGKENHEIKCRPSQTNPSADKAELFAILKGLEKSSSTIKLSVYTDSQNSITSINELDRNPSERNIIKIDDYPIVEKINHELKRFETRPVFIWVKGHEGEANNHLVHLLAQSACRDHEIEPQDVSAYKSGLALQRDFHLYHQLKEEEPESIYRTDKYPRSFFKNQFSLSLRQSNIDRLNRKWGEECPDLNDDEDRDNAARKAAIELDLAPDYDLTTKALNSVLDRTNHLDSSNQQIHSFRLNLMNRDTLYTLDLLNEQCKFWKRKGETCVNCKEMPETYDHIWECKHIYDQFNEYKKRTLELIREALKKRCSDNKTPFTDTHEDMITLSTNQFFHHDADQRDNNPQRFLSSLEAKGIITPQSNRSFHERANLINKSSGSWLHITTVASWTRALYEIWWKPRTKLIIRNKDRKLKLSK